MGNAELKLNLPKRSVKYRCVPYLMFGAKLPRIDKNGDIIVRDGEPVTYDINLSELDIVGEIYSYSQMKERIEELCKRSFDEFQKETGYSRGTVSHGLKALIKAERITQTKRFHAGAEYRFEGKTGQEFFVTFDECIKNSKFYIPREDKERKLDNVEFILLSILGACCNIRGKSCEFTFQELKERSGYCMKWVKKAIRTLINAELIYCKGRILYCRPNKRFKFNVRTEVRLLMIHTSYSSKKEREKAESEASDNRMPEEKPKNDWKQREAERAKAAELRGEFERYHAINHEAAIDRAEKNKKKAVENEDFKNAEREMKDCELALARAEVYEKEKVQTLSQTLAQIKERRRNALKAIAMTEDDLLPKWTCKKCSDTGFMKDGRMCDCYSSRGSP